MNKKNFITALLLVGFFAAGGWSANHYYQSSITKAEEGIPPDNTYYPAKNEEIVLAEQEMNRATQEEMKKGCYETDERGHKVFCEESLRRLAPREERLRQAWLKSQMPVPEVLTQRLAAIRDLREDQTLTIEFDGESGNPYLNSNRRRMEDYRDNRGDFYIIDKITGTITQYGPGPNAPDRHKFIPILSKEELKKQGLAYLTKHVKNFDRVQKEFTFKENTKGEEDGRTDFIYALRWEGKKIQGEYMPPFVQLVMTSAGDITTFNDTRVLYSE